MNSKIEIGIANRLDEHDFNLLCNTDSGAKMIKNRMVLYYDISSPNATINAIEDFIEANVKGFWYKRAGFKSMVYYFEQKSEYSYVLGMLYNMVK